MRVSVVARKYAKALFESAGDSLAQVILEVRAFSSALSSEKATFDFFANPVMPQDLKIKALDSVTQKMSPTTVGFLKTIITNDRITSLAGIVAGAQLLIDSRDNVQRGEVFSAQPLADDIKKRLEETIHAVVKKKMILSYETRVGLLGGVVAQAGGWTFDDSLDSQLNKLKDELNRSVN